MTKKLLELLVSVDQNAETTGRYTDEELMDAAKKQGNHPGGRWWWGGRGSNNTLKILRKFSQKNNLVKEVNALRDIEIMLLRESQ